MSDWSESDLVAAWTPRGPADDYGRELPRGRGPWGSLAHFRLANERAGEHYFSPQTMAFFDSRVESEMVGGWFFVTSEQFHGSHGETLPRAYSVRCAREDATVATVGGFQAHASLEAAEAAAHELARRIGAA